MYLIHESTIKNTDGTIEITVIAVNSDNNSMRKYVYNIASEYAADKFHNMYRRGKKLHGKALAILNKYKIKTEV
jgi:hypothetical protein